MHTGNETQWNIRPLSYERIADLEKLFTRVYKRSPPKDFYSKKFFTGYTGIEFAGFIFYAENDLPVASLCIVPCFIQYGDQRVLAGQLVDGMTDVPYRKQGLFGHLEKEVIKLCEQKEMKFIFGFPNQESYPLLIKNGWKEIHQLDRFVIPLKHHPLKRLFAELIHLKKNSLDPARLIYEEERFIGSVISDGFAGIARNKEYLGYKAGINKRIIKLGGTWVWLKGNRDLLIGDISLGTEDFAITISMLQDFGAKSGTGKIQFHCSRGLSIHYLFSEYFAPLPSFRVIYKNIGSNIPPEKIKFTLADIDIF